MAVYLQNVFGGLLKLTPTTYSIIASIAMASGILLYTRRKMSLTTKALVYGALCAAMAFVLSYIRIYRWPQGGSITPASMLPLFVYSYIFGPAAGIAAGSAYGLLQLIQDPYILHPIQVLLDYILAFAALGLAGFARNNIGLGTLIGGFGRFFCSFLSGVIFFGSYAPEGMSPIIYSLYVNALIIGTDTVICFIVSQIPQIKAAIEHLKEKANVKSNV